MRNDTLLTASEKSILTEDESIQHANINIWDKTRIMDSTMVIIICKLIIIIIIIIILNIIIIVIYIILI